MNGVRFRDAVRVCRLSPLSFVARTDKEGWSNAITLASFGISTHDLLAIPSASTDLIVALKWNEVDLVIQSMLHTLLGTGGYSCTTLFE